MHYFRVADEFKPKHPTGRYCREQDRERNCVTAIPNHFVLSLYALLGCDFDGSSYDLAVCVCR